MNQYQLNALELYLDISKSMQNMSDKFASVGIIMEDDDDSRPQYVQNDYRDIIKTMDAYIVKVLNLEEECDAEAFFDIIIQYLNGEEEKKKAIEKIEVYVK